MRYNKRNPNHFAASFPAPEKGRIALAKWISQNTTGHVRGQGWYSPKDQELVFFYKTPSARMDAILAVAGLGVQGRVRSDLMPMKRAAPARTVTPWQAQDAAGKLGYLRTAEIVGPAGLSGASMAALVKLVSEAGRKPNPKRRRNPDLITWSGLNGSAPGGWRYRIEDKSRPGDPWFTVYLIPPPSSWAGGVVEPMASRSSLEAVKHYAERSAAEIAQRGNPSRRRR